METAIVIILLFIATQVFECARFLGKIFRLMIVQAGDEKFRQSINLGKD